VAMRQRLRTGGPGGPTVGELLRSPPTDTGTPLTTERAGLDPRVFIFGERAAPPGARHQRAPRSPDRRLAALQTCYLLHALKAGLAPPC